MIKSRQVGSVLDDNGSNSPLLDHPSSVSIKIEDDLADRPEKKDHRDSLQKTLKLLFCFVGLQVSYLAWGVSQEQLMTNQYKLGKFTSSSFCVFGNRFFALIVALFIVLYKKVLLNIPLKEAPYYYYAPSSISNSLSSWAQYEALKFLSFPTQVLSKSCKVIPVMIVGVLLNGQSYPLLEYLEAFAITTGVALFSYSEKIQDTQHTDRVDTTYGALLLALYLCCDSFTSQWQSRAFKSYKIDQYQMMLGVNVWSIIMTGATLLYSGEMFTSIAFLLADSQAFWHMFILSVTSATGQLFIFYTIKEYGPVIFTIIMTTRQVISLFLSCILFSHTLNPLGWVGSLIVFGIVFNRMYRKGSD